MVKVDFYIAGVQKSGTTNLAYLLSKSSNILTHPQTECTFYWDTKEYLKGHKFLKQHYFFHADEKDWDNHYVLLKHSNSFTNTDILKKAYKDNPDIRFLLIFRHPVQRFLSSYLMEKTRSLYPHSLEYAVQKALSDEQSFEHKVFLQFGWYDVWFKKILGVIPENNVEIFLFDDLYNDKETHLKVFAEKYNLNFDASALKNTEIKNSYKEHKHDWYQKLIVKLRHSKIKEIVKQFVPVNYWVKLIQKAEHINLLEPSEKVSIDKPLEELLMEHYAPKIAEFEQVSGLKTNWLQTAKV